VFPQGLLPPLGLGFGRAACCVPTALLLAITTTLSHGIHCSRWAPRQRVWRRSLGRGSCRAQYIAASARRTCRPLKRSTPGLGPVQSHPGVTARRRRRLAGSDVLIARQAVAAAEGTAVLPATAAGNALVAVTGRAGCRAERNTVRGRAAALTQAATRAARARGRAGGRRVRAARAGTDRFADGLHSSWKRTMRSRSKSRSSLEAMRLACPVPASSSTSLEACPSTSATRPGRRINLTRRAPRRSRGQGRPRRSSGCRSRTSSSM